MHLGFEDLGEVEFIMLTNLKKLAPVASGFILSGFIALAASSVSALTLNFDSSSQSSNSPATGASAVVTLSFSDVATGVGIAGSVQNTTGTTSFGSGATAATLTGFGFDLVSPWAYVSNSFIGNDELDTFIMNAAFQPFGILDIAAADNGNFNGGNANGGLTTGNTAAFSLVINGGTTTAAQLETAMNSAFDAGTLQAGVRFQQVTGDANYSGSGSDKLNLGPSTVPLPAAGWLLIAAIGGLGAIRRRKSKG